mgnify:CR=1 FL=1
MNKELKSIVNNLGESTAVSYTASYHRLRKLMELKDKRKPIHKIPLADILAKIESVENPSTRASVFLIAKKLSNYADNKTVFDDLDMRIRNDKRDLQIKKNKNLVAQLPSYAQIAEAVKNETGHLKYIISFIVLKISTRNQDIAFIDVHKDPKDEYDLKRNHLILDGKSVIFIRNVYKTAKTYGQKKNIIINEKFYNFLELFLDGSETKPLLTKKDGSPIDSNQVGSYMKRYIVLKLTEGEVLKAVLKYTDESGSYEKLRLLSFNRGTAVSTLLSEYDISNIKAKTEPEVTDDGHVSDDSC